MQVKRMVMFTVSPLEAAQLEKIVQGYDYNCELHAKFSAIAQYSTLPENNVFATPDEARILSEALRYFHSIQSQITQFIIAL